MEKVLITGADGYLGACVFEEISSNKTKLVHKLNCRLDEIKPLSLDYDMVIHCAGALRYRKGEHSNSNTDGTKKLISGLKKNTKLVYISSKSIYGTKLTGTFTEQAAPMPDDDYGISKYKGELLVQESGHPYMNIRSSTLFGLGVNNLGIAFPSVTLQQLFQGQNISLYSPDVFHEYLYVKDLASIISKLIDSPDNWNEAYNVSGQKLSLSVLINAIAKNLNNILTSTGKIQIVEKESNSGFFLDSSKLIKTIGEDIYTPNETVINQMCEYIQSQ